MIYLVLLDIKPELGLDLFEKLGRIGSMVML